MLPETDERGAFIVAERLRRATHRTFADAAVKVTISFGVASCPMHGTDAVGLLRAADRAVAAAKELGSDRTVIYSDEVARTLALPGGQVGRSAPARHGDRARRGARHPRHRHGSALAHGRALLGADGARARPGGGARGARAARGRAARHRQDRHLGPRALEARSARRGRVAGDVHAPRDRRAAPVAPRVRRSARLDPCPPRASGRRGLPLRPERRRDPARGAHPRRRGRLRGDDGRPRATGRRSEPRRARAELKAGAGSQFDAQVVSAFVRALDVGRARPLRAA